MSVLELSDLVGRARAAAHGLYDGVKVSHRSCGIAIAETFGCNTRSYQALRKGGITGCGECGAIKGGELVLGELLGDPDPAGAVTDALRTAANRYRELWTQQVELGTDDNRCNAITARFDNFRGPERHAHCTQIAASVAACVAQALIDAGAAGQIARPIDAAERTLAAGTGADA